MKFSMLRSGLLCLTFLWSLGSGASISKRAEIADQKMNFDDKFRQLEELLPTPNDYRTASGAPGYRYWQQQVDYKMDLRLDVKNQRISGEEIITYKNNSPDSLYYLWLHLESRSRDQSAGRVLTQTGLDEPKVSYRTLRNILESNAFDLDYRIESVTDMDGKAIPHTINDTMMRVDLPRPLRPTRSLSFKVKWSFNIHDQKAMGGRFGYEFFKEKNNYIYQMSVFYPRLAAYSDAGGWHNKQFLGGGEFTLEFGDYEVNITVPADHVVAATGTLENPSSVLSSNQRQRLSQAKTSSKPMYIITPEEAKANEAKGASGDSKTWRFKADKVRDFAFASSPKFIWDAQGLKSGGQDVMAMSYYPEEATPLWETYSTHAIVHTIEQYNQYTFDYPYPTAISVNGPVGGMEYPMITFNGPRPEIDKKTGERSYSRRTKYGLISVIIHEIGHNYFPMIVNSDERQWTWMDEGVNTFVQFLAEQSWEENYPSRRGEARNIIDYMASEKQVPIMTNSESLWQFGNNAYGKPATALNILRETILGRELFDFAFREYARRWKFKRPMPADFFRTMEDASGVDLDWFWRGWFYSTDHVDISLEEIHHFTINTQNKEVERSFDKDQYQAEPESITKQRNRSLNRRVERYPELSDFYNRYDRFTVTGKDRKAFDKLVKGLEPEEKALLQSKKHFYQFEFANKGGLVMPIILQLKFSNGSEELLRIPAEIWRRHSQAVSKVVLSDHELVSATVDPFWETADVDTYNNHFPRKPYESRLQVYKREKSRNLMKEMAEDQKAEAKTSDAAEESTAKETH
ncbi:M1 family metallopeptidase [Pseudobacteriovorax antillogorgiicola]|uniref:Peptidase family M1 n=1 Tax=Pseudobacteriovorax antillogorgiicola TaxID=1513793 RepID=A0A1Y6BYA0_9BACT|nr:M1 family metallopeptidase [Pseudobacteriovorax antillogorgiicola]TCS53048.1 peptidase M1-like protein [Pseudobacteriovorax antillogorgiicola]SMF26432.1 Peptidase family M1 [Pseudobacteriovorax antillogorgiicola]